MRRWRKLSDRSWSDAGARVSGRGVPRSAAQEASSRSRFRRERRERRLSVQRFFYPGPLGLDPELDGGFVSLDGPTLRLLGAPAQRMQDASDVVDMIANSKDLLDHLNDPGTGPEVRRKARPAGASKQDRFQSLLGPRVEPWRPPWQWLGSNSSRPALQEARFPAPDAAAVNSNPSRDLPRQESFLQLRHGTKTSLFQVPCTSGWSHRFPPDQSIGHLLCRSQ